MLADLDFFKQVNDRHGHAAGDAVLCAVTERLSAHLRAEELLARIGGEEFLIVLPDTPRDRAERVADRLCEAIRATPVTVPGVASRSRSRSASVSRSFQPAPGHPVPQRAALSRRGRPRPLRGQGSRAAIRRASAPAPPPDRAPVTLRHASVPGAGQEHLHPDHDATDSGGRISVSPRRVLRIEPGRKRIAADLHHAPFEQIRS